MKKKKPIDHFLDRQKSNMLSELILKHDQMYVSDYFKNSMMYNIN